MMRGKGIARSALLLCALAVVLAAGALPAAAQNIGHFGKNQLSFARVGNRVSDDARGKGIVDYRGGDGQSSRWRASFRFSDLDRDETYTVVVKGRFGDDDSEEANDYTPLCSFETDLAGRGSCFWYFRGLERLDVVQLREGNEDGPRVMQASRENGPGAIETNSNRYSPGGEIPNRKVTRKGKS